MVITRVNCLDLESLVLSLREVEKVVVRVD